MSGSGIPHLSTLLPRGGLRGRAARGRGRAVGDSESPLDPKAASLKQDAAIQGTDNDAASSRASAVALGYLSDPYAQCFSPSPPPRRYPLINRGTYVRTTALDNLIIDFLGAPSNLEDGRKQIISLGAGSDTRFFRVIAQCPNLVYHEIDFATNTTSKIAKILETPKLKQTLSEPITVSEDKTSLQSPTLNIHALDLRSISSSPSLPNIAQLPTLIISECCLTYFPTPLANDILSHFISLIPSAPVGIVQYDPIKPLTPFGRTMVSNLSSRGITMPSLSAVPTLEAHRRRLRDIGLHHAGGRTVGQIYAGDASAHWVTAEERTRIERLEWLDEVEEWDLLAAHYAVTWGWRDTDDAVFRQAWADIDGSWREDERADDELHGIPSPGGEKGNG